MAQPYASIIITTYNQSLVMPYILEALSQQAVDSHFEVIISDDGSKAEHLSAVLKAIEDYSKVLNISFVRQADEGFRVARARNNAIRLARGEIIVTLDGDIIPESPSWLQSVVDVHKQHPRALTFTHRTYREAAEISASESSLQANRERFELERFIKKNMRPWQRAWSFNISFRLTKDSYFDENFVNWGLEDGEFGYRLLKQVGYTLHEIDHDYPVHINHAGPAPTNPFVTKSAADMVRFIDNAIYFYEAHKDDEILETFKTIPNFDDAVQNGYDLEKTIARKFDQSITNLRKQRELFMKECNQEGKK